MVCVLEGSHRRWAGATGGHRPHATDRRSQGAPRLWHTSKSLHATVAGARPSGTTALLEDTVVPLPALLDTCEK